MYASGLYCSGAFIDRICGYGTARCARWLSRDPLGESGGLNLYGYVGNNPTNMVDPFGKNPAMVLEDGILLGEAAEAGALAFDAYKIQQASQIALAATLAAIRAHNEANPAPKSCPAPKPSSPGKMQKEVERDQAPDEIDSVHPGHIEGQEPHIHYDRQRQMFPGGDDN